MLIVPAIDLRGGRCVRLVQGDYRRELSYDADPLEMADSFSNAGAKIIHVVDLDGAKFGEPQNWEILERLARECSTLIEFGGGVRTLDTARRILDLGVHRVVIGTKLIQDQALAGKFFLLGDQVVAGIDAKDGLVAVSGWTESSNIRASELARQVQAFGARRIILTDIARDGMLTGPNLALLDEIMEAVTVPIIHSGGISSESDLEALLQARRPIEGAIIGRAIYDGKLALPNIIGRFQEA